MEAAAVAVQAATKASRVDVADLGRKALEGVSQVATGLTTYVTLTQVTQVCTFNKYRVLVCECVVHVSCVFLFLV
jgi:hypothetical protein